MSNSNSDNASNHAFYPMSLDELRETLNEYSEMEVYYKDIRYSLTIQQIDKENQIYRTSWYRCTEPHRLAFAEEGKYDDLEYRKELVERMLNAPIFDDGKSFAKAINNVSIDWFD